MSWTCPGHYKAHVHGRDSPERPIHRHCPIPLPALTAGTGKTYLINAIRSRLQELAGTGSKSPVVVLAPTGVAAFNINGATIHSKLSIPIINDAKASQIRLLRPIKGIRKG